MSQCWAYGPDGKRCYHSTDDSHPVDEAGPIHEFLIQWTDDECIDPTQFVMKRLAPDVPAQAHRGSEGCQKHGCRSYIP